MFQINQDQAQPRAQMVSRDDAGKEIPVEKVEIAKKPYQFLWVSILREYLAFEFKPEGPLSFEWDQERVYDDFGEKLIIQIIGLRWCCVAATLLTTTGCGRQSVAARHSGSLTSRHSAAFCPFSSVMADHLLCWQINACLREPGVHCM